MSTTVAPSTLFRASALAANGLPWLVDGFHLRVKLNPWIGFPLHPFAAWRIEFAEFEQVSIQWRDQKGKALSVPFDVEQVGGYAEGTIYGGLQNNPLIWLEIDVDDRGLRIDLLDNQVGTSGGDRIVASRSRWPFRFGHTAIGRVRATDFGTILGASGLRQDSIPIEGFVDRSPDFTFGLPLEAGDWFAPDPNVDPLGSAKERVELAAPFRLSPPDNPGGGPDSTLQSEEAQRIMDRIAPEFVDPWLVRGWNDWSIAPAQAVLDDVNNAQQAKVSAPVTSSLLTMAVDPQIACYLGLATTIQFGDTPPEENANIWVIASRWAIQRDRVVVPPSFLFPNPVTLGDLLASTGTATWLDPLFDGIFPDSATIVADLPNRPKNEHGTWSSMPLIALAVAAGEAPPDPPDPFQLEQAEPGRWNVSADGATWRQTISLGDRPARGMVGFARNAPDGPVGLHRFEPPPNQGYVSRALPIVPNWSSNHQRVLEDRLIPVDPAGAEWIVWQADEFGQWGDGATIALPLPLRPSPPTPVIEATYRADPDDGSTGARVPGTLRLAFEVPDLAHTEPGGLPIVELHVIVDGIPLPVELVNPGDTVVLHAEPRPFGVGEQRDVPIVATYIDEAGTSSALATVRCGVYDARAPRAIPTSPTVIWTGQMDATGQAELALRWPPRAGAARYRVYLGDARRLAGGLGISLGGNPVRASQAKPIHSAAANLTRKSDFTFIGEIPGTASADGFVHFSTQIPGGLRSVQFVRIVPVSAGGAEPAFQTCGLVPVAIPSPERPTPPLLAAVTDLATGVTLTIRARGLRPELLAAAPGAVPQFRLRRTQRNIDRRFAPVWTSGNLSGPDADGVWTATVIVPPAKLEPFVRTSWFAEVRYPPEPALPPGMTPIPIDGGVEPVWSTIGASSDGFWSEASLAAESLLVPRSAPAAAVDYWFVMELDGSWSLGVGPLPVAHAAAVGPYQLEIYRGLPGEASTRHEVIDVLEPVVVWTDPEVVPVGARYDLVIVDPIGRRSPTIPTS